MIRNRLLWLILLLILPAFACDIPDVSSLRPESGPPPTATPMGDTLTLLVPIYTINLDPGTTVPGTALRYVGESGDGYSVTIDGQPALKRSGDSFSWSGVIAPGVIGSYNLRLTTTLFGKLTAAGPVNLSIFNPTPSSLASFNPVELENTLYFSNIAVQYRLPQGRELPGTTLVYQGTVEPGPGSNVAQTMANFSGIQGYNLFAVGDSLSYRGKLLNNVYISYSLRIATIDEFGINMLGTAELWIK